MRKTLWSVDMLRAYAVLGVVVFHSIQFALSTQPGVHGMAHLSKVGLDIFFVLSGFLVWKATREQRATPLFFMAHRFSRIAPVYTIATLLFVVYLTATGLHFGNEASIKGADIVRSLLYIPYPSAYGQPRPVLGPGWTLNYDMYYFVLVSIILAIPKRFQLPAALVIFTVPAALFVIFRPTDPLLVLWSHPRMLGFLGGILIAEAYLRGWMLPKLASVIVATGGALVYLLFVLIGLEAHGFGVAPWIAVAIVVAYGGISIEVSGARYPKPPFIRELSAWSYCIYLFQVFSVTAACTLLPKFVPLQVAVSVIGSVVLGKLAYEWIEAPINKALLRFERSHGLREARPEAVEQESQPALQMNKVS